MTSTLTTQDESQASLAFDDSCINVEAMPWTPFSEGIDIKVLRVSTETGYWTALFRCAKGSGFARHRHLGAAEYLMLSGTMEGRGGRENGGFTAYAGDYGYEPLGAIHDWTNFPEDTVFYFAQYGPLEFLTDDDQTAFIVDWRAVEKLRDAAKAGAASV